MRWPVLLIGVILAASLVVFAMTYGGPEGSVTLMPLPATSSTTALYFGTSTHPYMESASGVQGRVRVRCLTDSQDPACAPQVWTIQAYQGIASVALFKTAADGSFQSALPPGHYELRADAATSTRCVSIGIVVPETGYISTNLSCEAGMF